MALTGATQTWVARAPDTQYLYWLSADKTAAYLGGYSVDDKKNDFRTDKPPRVRRVALATGKWMTELRIGSVENDSKRENETIQRLLSVDKYVVVLSRIFSDDNASSGESLLAYRVTCFEDGKVTPLWSKRFQAGPTNQQRFVYRSALLRHPIFAGGEINYLARLGNTALICGGANEDIMCLDLNTGEKRWWFERIWEEERDFAGPSLWQYTLGTARSHSANGKEQPTKETPRAGDKNSNTVLRGSVIGGPVVVPAGTGEQRVFIAVARTLGSNAERHIADCVIYESTQDGALVSMTTLPRLVQGQYVRILPDGIVWACERDAFVRLKRSKQEPPAYTVGPRNFDRTTTIPWYRELNDELGFPLPAVTLACH
jgi:hypothetical protein